MTSKEFDRGFKDIKRLIRESNVPERVKRIGAIGLLKE